MCNSTATYASSLSMDVAAYEDLPAHQLPSIRNLIATMNDETYHGSDSEVPPPQHWGTKWDFSSVPGPMVFWCFLNAANY
jgi:hypothetical protein